MTKERKPTKQEVGPLLRRAVELTRAQIFSPLLGAAITTPYQVGVGPGFPPEALVLELYMSGEMAYVFKAMAELGLIRQARLHSLASQFGGCFVAWP